MEVQKFLRSFSDLDEGLDSLEIFYGIKVQRRDNLIVLNYNILESPKGNEFENDCRGLILEYPSFEILSRSFRRFFNYGEKFAAKIDWKSAIVLSKEDGTMCCWSYYFGAWHCATRQMPDAEGELVDGMTFADAFRRVIPNPEEVFQQNKDYSYIFEYVGPYNRIVTRYEKEEMILLTIFDKKNNLEFTFKEVSEMLPDYRRPKIYNCNKLDDVIVMI